MKIDVQMKVNEHMDPETSEVAAGWVEIEDCIKFPCKVRKYVDKNDGKEKLFVTYPQRKTGKGYEGVIYPHDKEVRKELEERILSEMQKSILKSVAAPPVTDVRVTLLKDAGTPAPKLTVVNRGIATIKIAGITINGLMIREGPKGLSVHMPQHATKTGYRDTVYGTNRVIQERIREEVLYVYQKELELAREKGQEPAAVEEQSARTRTLESVQSVQQEESPENVQSLQQEGASESMQSVRPDQQQTEVAYGSYFDELEEAMEKEDLPAVAAIIGRMPLEVDLVNPEEKTVQIQFAAGYHNEDSVLLRFTNDYDPDEPIQDIPPEGYLQKIDVSLYREGKTARQLVLKERKSGSAAEGAKNYQEVYREWRSLTSPGSVLAKRPEKKPEEPARAVRM